MRNSPIRFYETTTTRAPEIAGGGFGAGLWGGANRAEHPYAIAPNPNLAALQELLDDPTALTALDELNIRRVHEPWYYQRWQLEDHVDGLLDRLARRGAALFIDGLEVVASD